MRADEAFRAGESAEGAGDFVAAAGIFSSYLDSSDAAVAALARFHLARVTWKQGNLDAALDLCDEARTAAIKLDDRGLRARVENAVGVLHVARGEYAQARAAYAVALELTTDTVTRAKIALNLGVIANIQGSIEIARRHYAQALGLFREARDHQGEALALHNMGMLHADCAEWHEAEEAFRGALALFEHQGNRQMVANVLVNRSEVTYGRGRVHEGIAQCDLALSVYAEIGDEVGRGEALRWKGHGLRRLARHEEASRVLDEATHIAERTRNRLLVAEVTRELSGVRAEQGNAAASRALLGEALLIFAELGARREVEDLRAELGEPPPP